ncbi:MAG TPA: hypothetical protein VGE12_08875, partial [Noviherbaspirillum sp.]
LTLYVALRARSITFAQGRALGVLLLRRFVSRPRDFLLPPPGDARTEDETTATTHDEAARPPPQQPAAGADGDATLGGRPMNS